MPTSARRPAVLLVDTSVAVALIVEDHVAHDTVIRTLRGRRLGLSGHAYFETYSVLTRLPTPMRRSAADVTRLLGVNFPETRFLGADDTARLSRKLGELGVSGGSVYDALVGAAAVESDLRLVTRDRRALDTYRSLDVEFRFVE